MPKKTEGKKSVLLAFEDDLFLDAKKVLFKNNINLQQYFTFVLHRLVLEDPSAKDLLKKAVLYSEESLTTENKKEILKINVGNLYSMFERQDQENKDK
jgi:hypothetical protein